MKKIISLIIIFLFISLNFSFSFQQNPEPGDIGSGGREDDSFMKNPKNSNFKKGKDRLKQGLKLKKKEQNTKANKYFEMALKFFVLSYKETPENIEVLNYLGFTYNVLEDYLMSEIYYQEALVLDPKNPTINQKLGELYFNTKRISLAKERLNVLSSCNCEEYSNLKNIIPSAK